jgi:hypothetical protein
MTLRRLRNLHAMIISMAPDGPGAEPFHPELGCDALADLARRLEIVRLPPQDTDTWERGVPGNWLAGLIDDWRAFDPGRLQARLDQLTHLRVEVGGVAVHVVHATPWATGGSLRAAATWEPASRHRSPARTPKRSRRYTWPPLACPRRHGRGVVR